MQIKLKKGKFFRAVKIRFMGIIEIKKKVLNANG
jgi:hypothetical protein